MSETMSRRSFIGKSALVGTAAIAAGVGLAGCASGESKSGAAAKPVILVVSFGTSFNDSRNITIGAVESSIREAYPDYDVRRAFTAQIIIDKLKERDGIAIDNVEEALDRCVSDGVTELIVQPTHLMDGFEYNDLADALEGYKDKIEKISLGAPLLTSDADYDAVIKAIVASTEADNDGQTAICYMGHGTEAESNEVYTTLQEKFNAAGYNTYFVGTVEAEPTCADVIAAVQAAGLKKAVLRPLMVVAGDHANNDMADPEDPESWISQFTAAGIDTRCVIEGLGQLFEIDQVYVAHTKDAIAA